MDSIDRTRVLRQRHRGMQKLRHYWRRTRSPCLSSLTEKNEKRAIFALSSSRPKFFHYTWKLCIRRSVTSSHDGQNRGRCSPERMNRSRKQHCREMEGCCLTATGTWEKLQSRIMKYIARINVARYAIPTRRSDIFQHCSWISTLPNGTSTIRGVSPSLCHYVVFIANCVGRTCWRLILFLFTRLTRNILKIIFSW